jgi:hypothetical protein
LILAVCYGSSTAAAGCGGGLVFYQEQGEEVAPVESLSLRVGQEATLEILYASDVEEYISVSEAWTEHPRLAEVLSFHTTRDGEPATITVVGRAAGSTMLWVRYGAHDDRAGLLVRVGEPAKP